MTPIYLIGTVHKRSTIWQILACISLYIAGGYIPLVGQNLDFTFHHISEADGLTQAEAYHLSKDSKGYLWIGTDDGLLRFDGKQLHRYQLEPDTSTLSSASIITSRCFEDSSQNLWFSTSDGIYCYRRRSDTFEKFMLPDVTESYQVFHIDSKHLWAQVGNGKKGSYYLFDIVSKTFQQQGPLQGNRCSVIHDHAGKAKQLISSEIPGRAGVDLIDLASGDVHTIDFRFTTNGIQRNYPSFSKGVFTDHKSEHVWVGLYNGLGRYTLGEDSGLVVIERNAGVDRDLGWIYGISPYTDDLLLLATEHGLVIFDQKQEKFIKQFKPNPLRPFSLQLTTSNNIFIDDQGTLWLSNSRQEVAFTHLSKQKFFALEAVQGQYIHSITEDANNRIWCSTIDSGTYVFNQKKELLFHTKNLINKARKSGPTPLPGISFFLQNKEQDWWANLGNYFFAWKPTEQAFELKPSYFMGIGSDAANRINHCYQNSKGEQLIARGSTILKLNLSPNRVSTTPWHNLEYLQLGTINALFEDKNGHIFIGDNNGKLVVCQEEGTQLKVLSNISKTGTIYDFYETENDTLWLATSEGLGLIRIDSLIFTLLTEDGYSIPNEVMYNIETDQNGYLWLTSNNGLIRYHPSRKNHHRFNIADGLMSPVFSPLASIKASKTGDIWVGGKNGVNVFQPETVKLIGNKPDVSMAKIWVNDNPYQPAQNLNTIDKLEFEYGDNTLSFEFVALDYSDPTSNQFTCQMVGYDKDSVKNGTRNFIRYANLPIGKYTFKVWAKNSDGIENEVPLQLGITIIPPFYRTWWFYLLSTIAICGLMYAIFRYRMEQALKVERLRVKISSDLHDDVGGILTGLAMQSEILELTAKDDTKPKLARIAELSRNAMSRMRDTVWVIDARKDSLGNLIDRMHEHAEETLSPKGIQYSIDVENMEMQSHIATDIRQSLYLIYKEAVTNIVKHSNGDKVHVRLEKDGKLTEMMIHDNGSSNEKSYKTTGLGLSNMKMRAEQIGASFEVSKENGFTILMKMKSFA